MLCPSAEPKLPDSASTRVLPSLPPLSLSPFFSSHFSVTCCEIPRRRQEEKNQEAGVCFLFFFWCAAKPTARSNDCFPREIKVSDVFSHFFSTPFSPNLVSLLSLNPRADGVKLQKSISPNSITTGCHGNKARRCLRAPMPHWHWPIANEMSLRKPWEKSCPLLIYDSCENFKILSQTCQQTSQRRFSYARAHVLRSNGPV